MDAYKQLARSIISTEAQLRALVKSNPDEKGMAQAWDAISPLASQARVALEENGDKLPPDVDGQNGDRAAWAGLAISAFIEETGVDEEYALGDLLSNLMHWCDRNDYDFEAALERARGHYAAETGQAPY